MKRPPLPPLRAPDPACRLERPDVLDYGRRPMLVPTSRGKVSVLNGGELTTPRYGDRPHRMSGPLVFGSLEN